MKELRRLVKDWQEYLNNYKYIILTLMSISLLAIVVVFKLIPLWQQHLIIERENKIYEKKINALESFAAKHRAFEEQFTVKQKELARLRLSLPQSLQQEEYLGKLQQAAKSSGAAVAISRLTERQKSQQGLEYITLDFKVAGSYKAIINFLERLEEYKNISMEKLKIEADNVEIINAVGFLRVYTSK